MRISVLTPDRQIFEGNITSVRLPGTDGQFQVLENHAPIVAGLSGGRVELVTGAGEYNYFDEESEKPATASQAGKRIAFNIDGGFLEVLHNEVSLLVRGARNMR